MSLNMRQIMPSDVALMEALVATFGKAFNWSEARLFTSTT
jgi:hypothetical protein